MQMRGSSPQPAGVVLAATHHDPDDRLYDQIRCALPLIAEVFQAVAIQATHTTGARSLELLTAAGALVRRESAEHFAGHLLLGRPRRAALVLALQSDAPLLVLCDFDRLIHWAARHPTELAQVVAQIAAYDFTVLGRTERAFNSHPRIQRDTETIINSLYATVSGFSWDVTAAARSLSRQAAAAILDGCPDETLGTDVSWPLFLQRAGGFSLGYIAAEGLEFETADRYGDEVAAVGGIASWLARLDADPRQWAQRLDMARVEVEAMLPYR
jgi:hypothetical protein